MRRLSAHYLFDGFSWIKYGILEIDASGFIIDIRDPGGEMHEESSMEFYPGLLVPGFVNSHCHLELSYLKDKMSRGKGLPSFIYDVTAQRNNATLQKKLDAAQKADRKMYNEGIVAVGDISNESFCLPIKKESRVHYHSFIEVIGLDDNCVEKMQSFKEIHRAYREEGMPVSYAAHAPYSIHPELWKLLLEHLEKDVPFSMHNQETAEENQLFKKGEGALKVLLEQMGFSTGMFFKTQYSSSLHAMLPYLDKIGNLLLVHNTYTGEKDLQYILQQNNSCYFAFCPESNLFIEHALPDISTFRKATGHICIGTDSYASSPSLSMLEQLKIIAEHFPGIPLDELIRWSSINGARALGIDDRFGRFEKGKSPGIVWIDHVDLKQMKLLPESKAQRLVP